MVIACQVEPTEHLLPLVQGTIQVLDGSAQPEDNLVPACTLAFVGGPLVMLQGVGLPIEAPKGSAGSIRFARDPLVRSGEKGVVMDQQEIGELLEELFHHMQTIRAVQVQFLVESDRELENKLHFRLQADAAWNRFKAIHQQLVEAMRQAKVAQEE